MIEPMRPHANSTAADGMAHLQGAAREMVAAARTFLDAIEEVVNDDERMGRVVDNVADLLKQATDAVSHVGRPAATHNETRVRHINVE